LQGFKARGRYRLAAEKAATAMMFRIAAVSEPLAKEAFTID
jgi:hypothetical protein